MNASTADHESQNNCFSNASRSHATARICSLGPEKVYFYGQPIEKAALSRGPTRCTGALIADSHKTNACVLAFTLGTTVLISRAFPKEVSRECLSLPPEGLLESLQTIDPADIIRFSFSQGPIKHGYFRRCQETKSTGDFGFLCVPLRVQPLICVCIQSVLVFIAQELRDELAARGLDKSGNKPALVERLENAVKLDKEGQQDASISKAEAVVESAPASDKAVTEHCLFSLLKC